MTFSTIRPVTQRFPASQDCLDESNLPFACVVTPLATDDDDDDDDKESEQQQQVQALTGIAKCLHCGSPHPNATTRFTFGLSDGSKNLLLCYLCGRVSSTRSAEQQALRGDYEGTTVTEPAAPPPARRTSSAAATTYALPLRWATSTQDTSAANTSTAPLYAVPAMTCPPLWFLVLDGSCTQRSYWQTVSQLLLDTLKDAPAHLHVSLLIASQQQQQQPTPSGIDKTATISSSLLSTVAIYQLSSAIPHVIHLSSSDDATRQDDLLAAVVDSLVPQSTHVQTAVRSLMDYVPAAAYTSSSTSNNNNNDLALPVAWMTQVILAALESTATPVGQRHQYTTTSAKVTQQRRPRPYAGGKITFFLSQRPAGVSSTHGSGTAPIGLGGFGGRVRHEPAGMRFSSFTKKEEEAPTHKSNSDDVEENVKEVATNNSTTTTSPEWTPTGLAQHYQLSPNNNDRVELLYADLGKQCAEAALGVDLLCLISNPDDHVPDFGLALCQGLSDKSGAAGPLLFDISSSANDADANKMRLASELQARSPWQPGRVFGAELRIRLSPGFLVDHQSVEYESHIRHQPQLAPLYAEAGLVGPASPVDDATHLWRMGTCDPYTCLTIDLALQRRKVKDRFLLDGFGEVALKPALQTCLAYTTVVYDATSKQYQTVRRMRIDSRPVPLAQQVEELYNALDPEALAVVLFHKLALASFQEGLSEAPEIAQNWLQSLLVCTYRSAEDVVLQQEQQQQQVSSRSMSKYFFPNERLLDREGDLPAQDVLLAQGHQRLASIPVMVYLLLQCDPLRPDPTVSLDLRVAALWQMSSMLPTTLARAIAPRLQLWECGGGDDDDEEPILPLINLSATSVQDSVMEFSQTTKNSLLLFLDAPDQLLVMNARPIIGQTEAADAVVSKALERAVQDAAGSYRSKPVIKYALKSSTDTEMLSRLTDVLVEDAPCALGYRNFSSWRAAIADAVNE